MSNPCLWCFEEKKEKQLTRVKPYSERSCTDILFLIGFIAGWIGIIIIFARAVELGGDPSRIVKPVDWKYRVCGESPGVQDRPYSIWPNPLLTKIKVCVASCDESQTNPVMVPFLNGGAGTYTSVRFVYYCIPFTNGTVEIKLGGSFNNVKESFSRAIGDVYTAWVMIVVSGFIALGMAFLYTSLTRFIAGYLVWLAILASIVGGFLLGYALLKKAKDYDDTQISERSKAVEGLGIAVIIATVLFICLVFFLRNRIRIAIAVIEEAAAALTDIKSLILFPLVPLLLGGVYFVWWIFVALYLSSVGEPVSLTFASLGTAGSGLQTYWSGLSDPEYNSATTFTSFSWNEDLKKAFAAHFFHLLWNIEFLIYFTFLVCAGTVASWYFTPYKDGAKIRGSGEHELSYFPVRDSFFRTIRFHLGTISLAAFIIAVIQMARAIVKYLEKQTKVKDQNRLQRCIFCVVQCCLYCLECCMDKINKNALIWTSIYGDNFGTAACSSFALLFRNLARVAAINLVGAYLMLLGKIIVAFATAGIAAIVFISYDFYKDRLSSIAMPCAVVFLLAFLVASIFMVMFETTIDTTFLCFLIDEENNGNNMFASPNLRQIVDKYHPESTQEANEIHEIRSREWGPKKTDPAAPAAAQPKA